MPYFSIDGESVYDKLCEPKFHLLAFSDGQSDHRTTSDKIESEYADLVDCHVLPLYPHVAEIFGTNKSFNVLLRPDNYVGFISPQTSSGELRAYINKFIERS